MIKIGLIAPFEGLYRRAGYEGLFAARMAVADHEELIRGSGVDLLVQALDDSAQPDRSRRAAQKLLVDPAVGAIVGPLAPWVLEDGVVENGVVENGVVDGTNSAVGPVTLFADSNQRGRGAQPGPFFEFPWAQPASWGGSVAGQDAGDPFSQNELVLAVMEAAAKQGVDRLLIGSETMGRVAMGPLPADGSIVVAAWTEETTVDEADSILWLGDPAAGAARLNRLREGGWRAPFWFGPWGGDPIVRERSNGHVGIFWAIWQDSHYNSWSENHDPSSPFGYLVYRATERAVGRLLNNERLGRDSDGWEVVLYEIRGDGLSYRFESR